MDRKKITEAAEEHAKKMLGETQWKKNRRAAMSIKQDFREGAKWMLSQMIDFGRTLK